VKPGVGLAFLAYPEVASNLPFKQLWAFLFFLMITILGLDSQVCMMEGLFTALEDSFPTLLRKYKKVSLLVTCIFFFILGIPMVTYCKSTLFVYTIVLFVFSRISLVNITLFFNQIVLFKVNPGRQLRGFWICPSICCVL
jgi:SNF family Na+-dependent transporter